MKIVTATILPINYREIDLIKAELQVAGITESSLFPELGGLYRDGTAVNDAFLFATIK